MHCAHTSGHIQVTSPYAGAYWLVYLDAHTHLGEKFCTTVVLLHDSKHTHLKFIATMVLGELWWKEMKQSLHKPSKPKRYQPGDST